MPPESQPIRVAFCITDLDPGGAERALVELVTRLDRARWEPFVVCLSGPGALVGPLEQAGVPVTCLGANSPRDVTAVWRLLRALRRIRPKLLQTFLFHANIAGRIAGRLAGVRCIVSGIRVAERRGRWPLRVDRMTNWMVDHNVAVSRAVAEFSIQQSRLRARKISVIPNGVDVERFANASPADLSEFGIPPESRTLLFVGRLDPQKGPLALLDAVEKLREPVTDYENVHVLYVGDGPLRGDLENHVVDRNLQSRIHFAGWRSDVPEIMRASFALMLPSLWEGMPNVVLEAMAAGLPVVGTDVEGVRELIQDGETGVVPPGSEDFWAGILILLENPPRAAKIARKAQQVVKQDFTWNSSAQQYEDLYESLLSR